jgi:fibronectin-binding autotransporter adhesin
LESANGSGIGYTLAIASGDITVASQVTGAITLFSGGSNGTMTVSTTAPAFTITNNSSQILTIGAILSGTGTTTLLETGAGTVALSKANTYGGLTQIDGGVLNISGTLTAGAGGTAQELGESSNAAGNLILGNGTLQDTSAAGTTTTDRLFTIGDANGNNATLDSSVSSQVFTFTNTGTIAFGTAATHTLILTGTGTKTNSFSPVLVDDSSYATSVIKSGVGGWTLSGANTYTGGTTIKAGSLLAGVTSTGSTGAFGTGTVTLGDSSGSANAALYANAAITVSNAITTAPGSTGTLTVGSTTGSAATFSGLVTLGNNLTVYQGNASALTLSGSAITSGASGTQTLTFDNTNTGSSKISVSNAIGGGTGTIAVVIAGYAVTTSTYGVALTGANTYTGGTTINSGSLNLGVSGTLGTGPLALNNTNTGAATPMYLVLATGANTTVGSLSGTLASASSGTNTATILTQNGYNFTVNQTTNGTYQGVIGGSGTFTLGSSSTATLTFTGTNTYTGGTVIAGGTLLVDNSSGSGTGTKAVSVSSGGTLGGTGTINTSTGVTTTNATAVDIASGGYLSPSGTTTTGFSHLTLTLHASTTANLETGAKLAFNLGTSTAGSDEVLVTGGQLSVIGQQFADFTFNVLSGTTITSGTVYTLIDSSNAGLASGSTLGAITTGTFDGGLYNGQLSLSGGDLDLTVTAGAVPEPSTWALMLGGLFFLAAFQVRRLMA